MTGFVRRVGVAVALGAIAALAVSGIGFGASGETSKISATLNAKQETPKQAVKVAGATGTFTGTVNESGATKKITWKLTFKGLSGAAMQAHIHAGKPGKAGPIILGLCGPCKSGAHGTAKVSEKVLSAIEKGSAYVNVHTAKNPAGEIRGQIKYS